MNRDELWVAIITVNAYTDDSRGIRQSVLRRSVCNTPVISKPRFRNPGFDELISKILGGDDWRDRQSATLVVAWMSPPPSNAWRARFFEGRLPDRPSGQVQFRIGNAAARVWSWHDASSDAVRTSAAGGSNSIARSN
jgi:hypothetical protein